MQEKAKELGFIPCIGDGTAILNSLHVKDVTPFVILLLSLSLREDSPKGSVYERCFIIGGIETPWKVASEAFAKAFHAKGLIKSPTAKRIGLEDAGEGEIPMLMSSNMRFVSPRAERLGFRNREAGLVEFLAEGKDIFL
jgi:hypothetical protein